MSNPRKICEDNLKFWTSFQDSSKSLGHYEIRDRWQPYMKIDGIRYRDDELTTHNIIGNVKTIIIYREDELTAQYLGSHSSQAWQYLIALADLGKCFYNKPGGDL